MCRLYPKSTGIQDSGTNHTPVGNETRKSEIDKVGHTHISCGIPIMKM